MLILWTDTSILVNTDLMVVSIIIGDTRKLKYIVAVTTTLRSKNYPENSRNVMNVTIGMRVPYKFISSLITP